METVGVSEHDFLIAAETTPGRVTLTGFELGHLPAVMKAAASGRIAPITHLTVRSAKFSREWQLICSMTTITELIVSECWLEFVPSDLARLNQLVLLDLSNNKLNWLPDSLAGLIQLKAIDLQRNKFTHLPAALEKMQMLEHLNISDNELQDVVFGSTGFPSLRSLSMYRTGISELPDNLNSFARLHFGIIGSRLFRRASTK